MFTISPFSLTDRAPDFESGDEGSNPSWGANL